ncbi:DUF2202 domain-containing protein [Algoriphagus sp. CAU 1675]|uniref:DUF2202 domain-containing protein n=1 Tax=Algoriphagus sp. CAU 1675 TaxID=3032597 RepID=UPI0023DA9B1D|nr:DUF2202 domain-containing protein [Algoriphagus sp. CAU 1675]MDF2157325.1 DUF2202 domain-containing protein [Algoriphagus sp. CAU 1675]
MKRLFTLAFVLLSFASCNEDNDKDPVIVPQISNTVKETLLFTREEEKMAHDVYVYAYSKYDILAFQNIANSESQHVAAVLTNMDRLNLEDPLDGSTLEGEFTIPAIQTLYAELIERVDQSHQEALLVGLYIEDLDIKDLQDAIKETSDETLKSMYENLMCGSKNHMRSFEGLASFLDLTYTPEFITQAEYDLIISTPVTTCSSN